MLRSRKFLNSQTLRITYLQRVAHYIYEHENITMLWLPGGGRTTFGMNLQNNKALHKIGNKRKLNKQIFIYIDLKLENQVSFQLEKYINETLSHYSSKQNLRDKVLDIVNHGYTLYFVLDNISTSTIQNLEYVLTFRSASNSRIKFIYLILEKDFYSIVNHQNALVPSSLFHNFIKIPYFDESETFEWLGLAAKTLKLKVKNEDKVILYKFCGGIPVLLKNCLRARKTYKNWQQLFNSFEITSAIDSYWKSLSQIEQQILLYAVQGKVVSNYPKETNYMIEHRLLEPNGLCTSKWIERVNRQISTTATF